MLSNRNTNYDKNNCVYRNANLNCSKMAHVKNSNFAPLYTINSYERQRPCKTSSVRKTQLRVTRSLSMFRRTFPKIEFVYCVTHAQCYTNSVRVTRTDVCYEIISLGRGLRRRRCQVVHYYYYYYYFGCDNNQLPLVYCACQG